MTCHQCRHLSYVARIRNQFIADEHLHNVFFNLSIQTLHVYQAFIGPTKIFTKHNLHEKPVTCQ